MSIYRELEYSANEISQVQGIRFTVLSPDDISRMSVCEITKTDTYLGMDPVPNGLFDARMGVIDPNKICPTCQQRSNFCSGHMAEIRLAKPVFYIQFFETVKKILKCVCFRCSKLLVDPNSDIIKVILSKKLTRQKRWDLIYKQCTKAKRCNADIDGCNAKQPDKIYRDSIVRLIMEWKGIDAADDVKKQNFRAEEVLRILKRITDADCETLGFNPKYNRPEWMICTVFPVPPPSVRPSVRSDTGQRSEDDLTHKLCDIVKSNTALRVRIEKGASKEQIDITTQLLQYHVATFIDNKIPGISPAQQRTGRLLKSLTERLKSKEGRIRGNLMGKRVDFSARSVITPDPNISIDELGVPVKIAMNLTFPEVVNRFNIDKLTQLIRNGPDIYPGAKFFRDGSVSKTLKNIDRKSIVLKEGMIVDRHLRNGDPVLFNRQPSLHRSSMLCHRVKVMPFNTFRLNVCVCAGYNADFDGDEMNLHAPQSTVTAVELHELASVNTQIISPRECKPLVSVVQDIALGIYRITKSEVMLSGKEMMNLMTTNFKFNGTIPAPFSDVLGNKKWSGRQALSSIIPKNITLHRRNKTFNDKKPRDDENYVKIENGEILQGTLDKAVYQDRTIGLVHAIVNECNNEEARLFFDNTQTLICNWLVNSGFSVGISDLIVDNETNNNLKSVIKKMKEDVYKKINDIHLNKYQNKSINKTSEYFEDDVNVLLNKTRGVVGEKATATIDDKNRILQMVNSGSKGILLNVSQMIGCLGQQNVDGKRISYGFDERTLPHYVKFDDGPDSHGFVENSFISGLSPQEFFFHAMGGREGLIDTAVKSVTGDTPIIIIEQGSPKYVQIGEWIDNHLDGPQKSRVKHYPEDRHMELLELNNNNKVYIPTADQHGNTTWGELTAVTRHDPGERLYEVKTSGGRYVIAAESKTLLIWDEHKKEFEAKNSKCVQVGDLVPVTVQMATPPIIIDHVDMSVYFPKNEYLHGTEYNKAIAMMKEAQGESFHIPRGWWEANNNATFTVPYPSKARLQRVLVRSNNENIHDGCVYPFHAMRERGRIPDKFDLNYENGVFIGLFLADGNTDTPAGTIQITKEDVTVQKFVEAYFDKLAVTHRTIAHQKERGISYGVIGSSTLLARFLDAFVGCGARHKHVPDVAFAAPLDFVRGILSGYVSGDGSIVPGGISTYSTSGRLTEGISMLCSRIGVFGKISVTQQQTTNLTMDIKDIAPMHTFSIRAQWAERFAKEVELVMDSKNTKMKEMRFAESHRNFDQYNDVVLDKIVEINVLGVEKYPKLYDVTVPSTLNFGTANGLTVEDTSETGYIQRRLVKAMEDCKINYDYTVRDASGSIVQFLYGEDGMDPTKIESQVLTYIGHDYRRLVQDYLWMPHDDMKYLLDDGVIKRLHKTDGAFDRLKGHFDQILVDREFMIKKIFKNKKEDMIFYPISFHRIIDIARSMFLRYDKGLMSDLEPMYVLDTIEKLGEELYLNKINRGNKFLNILLRCFLSPKRVCNEYRLNRLAFDHVIQTVRMRFYESIANPSEMIGVIAAQSIGEPATQLTLNTFHSSGISSASKTVRGVPRIKEILSVTRNIKAPSMTIYVKDDYKHDKKMCTSILNSIQSTYFKDIVSSYKIYYDPSDFTTNIEKDAEFVATYREFSSEMDMSNLSPWLLRLEFNKDKLLANNITMMDLNFVLAEFYDNNITTMFSDDNSDSLIARIKLRESENEERDMLTELKALEKSILENVVVKGIKKVNKVHMSSKKEDKFQDVKKIYDDETMQFSSTATEEWVLDTNGTNLLEVLSHDQVDATRTISNDINEIYEIFGIEAARQVLYDELMLTLDDLYVNYRHIALLIDTMTNRGYLMSIDRHGINRVDIGPLAKCSFEETTDMLIKAGIFSEVDKINGVSANIMLGQIPPSGTGDSDILIDEWKLQEFPDDGDHEEQPDTYKCSKESLSIDFTMPAMNDKIIKSGKQVINIVD